MKIKRKDLLTELEKVKIAILETSENPVLSCFYLNTDSIIGFNTDIAIVSPFEIGIKALVPADRFYKVVDKLDFEEVSVSIKKNDVLISSGKHKSTIKSVTDKDYPWQVVEVDETKWIPVNDDFAEGLKLTQFTICGDEQQVELNVAYLEGYNLVTTDNQRMSHYKLGTDYGLTCSIPKEAIGAILRLGKVTAIALVGEVFCVKFDGGTILYCVIVGASFPDGWKEYFGNVRQATGTTISFPSESKEGLKRVCLFAGNSDSAQTEIIVSKECITAKCDDEVGGIEEVWDIQTVIDNPTTFKVNPFHLVEIIPLINTMKLAHSLLYINHEEKNLQHIISIRVD